MKQGFDPSYDDYYSGPATKAAPATAPHVDEGRMGSDEDDGSEGGAREGDTLSSELRKYNHVKRYCCLSPPLSFLFFRAR